MERHPEEVTSFQKTGRNKAVALLTRKKSKKYVKFDHSAYNHLKIKIASAEVKWLENWLFAEKENDHFLFCLNRKQGAV